MEFLYATPSSSIIVQTQTATKQFGTSLFEPQEHITTLKSTMI